MRGEPIGPIPIQAPSPSILTTAKPKSNDDFGVRVPLPDEVDVPEGALDPSKASWRTGVSWVAADCAPSNIQQQCPTGDDVELDTMTEDAYGLVTSSPFWMFTPLECEWTTTPEEIDAQSEALTEARSAWGLGRALWMGDGLPDTFDSNGVADQPTLRNFAQVAPGGDVATPLEETFALLLAAYETATQGLGGQTLHVPGPAMVYVLGAGASGAIARQEGNFYRAALGAVVSPGPGYPWGASTEGEDGYGPLLDDSPLTFEGNDTDEMWIYITGPVEYALSKVIPLPTGTSYRRQNRKLSWSMRQLIYRFNPCSVWAALAQSPVPFPETS